MAKNYYRGINPHNGIFQKHKIYYLISNIYLLFIIHQFIHLFLYLLFYKGAEDYNEYPQRHYMQIGAGRGLPWHCEACPNAVAKMDCMHYLLVN